MYLCMLLRLLIWRSESSREDLVLRVEVPDVSPTPQNASAVVWCSLKMDKHTPRNDPLLKTIHSTIWVVYVLKIMDNSNNNSNQLITVYLHVQLEKRVNKINHLIHVFICLISQSDFKILFNSYILIGYKLFDPINISIELLRPLTVSLFR